MYDYVRRFGFGVRPGLPLPGESPGLVWPAKRWQPSSLASVSMGHEVMVTTVQLARACSVIANGGLLVKPRLVEDAPQVPPRRVIKPETAITMRKLMEGVVLYGTGKFARLAGYSCAGKTGTAQIVDLKTHRYTHLYNSSFMGFAPLANPAIVIVVTGNGSSGNAGFGAEVAAPVFKAVAEAALRYLDVPKDLPDVVPSPDTGKDDNNDLAIADLGSARLPLVAPDDAADYAAPEGDQRETLLPPAEVPPNLLKGPKAPNFVGMTMKDVVQQSSADGIPVEFQGHGIARAQVPPAGTMLPPGQSVKVQFAR
jgi:cell division protein FtsI (penicillin-binding protein 3)